LVVDDEPAVRHITQQTLEAFGYRVVVAVDGTEAVAIYARRGDEIAVVLTDMMMPVMDGPATIRVLRKMNPAVRIVAASGLDANAHGVGLGITHFLPKPYAADRLLTTLRLILADRV
jgi:CheY-like chemotaxis protein